MEKVMFAFAYFRYFLTFVSVKKTVMDIVDALKNMNEKLEPMQKTSIHSMILYAILTVTKTFKSFAF